MSNKPLFLLCFIVFFLYSLNSSAEFLKKELLISNSDNELKYFKQSAYQVKHSGPLKDIPIAILSRGINQLPELNGLSL